MEGGRDAVGSKLVGPMTCTMKNADRDVHGYGRIARVGTILGDRLKLISPSPPDMMLREAGWDGLGDRGSPMLPCRRAW